MRYELIVNNRASYNYNSFKEASKKINIIPMEIECDLIITGYSPITMEEALFFAETHIDECRIKTLMRSGYTAEDALASCGINILEGFEDEYISYNAINNCNL